MARIFLTFVFFLVFQWAIAQIPVGYYDTATGSGEVLRAQLRDITTSGHVKLPYTSAAFDIWDAYAATDVRPAPYNTTVWDMYSDIPSGVPVYNYTIYTDQCTGGSAAEGTCFSREHLVPNSWWGGLDNAANPQYTDLHHLFPADQYVNQEKSNYPIGEVSMPTYTSSNGSRVGPCSFPGYSGSVFEPIDEYKGDFARAYFYIATRYMDNLSTWVTSYPGTDAQYVFNSSTGNLYPWVVNMLVSWHLNDPVSAKEIARNDSIYYATPQHNRNPYIDHPEYVCLVWTSSYCSSAPIITNVTNSPASPAAVDSVNIGVDITDDGTVVSAKAIWCTDGSSFGDTLILSFVSGIHYNLLSFIPPQVGGTTISYKVMAVDDLNNIAFSSVYSYTIPNGSVTACASDLIFSEYVEGTSNNKYIEIFNGTGVSIDLSGYRLRFFANGSLSASQDIALSGTLMPDSVVVYKNSAAITYSGAALTNNAVGYNGNDALGLYKVSSGTYVDIFGRIGENPGTAWTSGSFSTVDKTLVRNSNVYSGITTNPTSGFPTLATEWTQYNTDDVSHLGNHTTSCLALPVELVSFSAKCTAQTELSWTTASETGSACYTIQRSSDMETWQNMQQIMAAGNSSTLQYYFFSDAEPGSFFYRLIETDFDGKQTILSVVASNCFIDTGKEFVIYPNPTSDAVNIYMPQCTGNIAIYNIQGVKIISHEVDSPEGNVAHIETNHLLPGKYWVFVESDRGRIFVGNFVRIWD